MGGQAERRHAAHLRGAGNQRSRIVEQNDQRLPVQIGGVQLPVVLAAGENGEQPAHLHLDVKGRVVVHAADFQRQLRGDGLALRLLEHLKANLRLQLQRLARTLGHFVANGQFLKHVFL